MNGIEGKTVMVTGGAGFIGSRFSARLLGMGARVVVYDNLSSGRYEMIEGLTASKDFSFIKGDILDKQNLDAQFKKYDPDLVVHLAANPDIRASLKDTSLDLNQGTISTYNVLDASRKSDIDGIIFSSSGAIYGESMVMPTPENYGPLAPISLYGASKLASEGLITSFSHLFGFDHYICRFANVVGNNLTHGIIFDLAAKLKTNKIVLQVLGDGNQKKGYIDVDDCISGIMLVYQKSSDRSNIYNIAPDDQITVREIAEMVVEMLSPKTEIKYTESKGAWPGDIPYNALDNSRIKGLGFKPKYGTSSDVIRHAIEANRFVI